VSEVSDIGLRSLLAAAGATGELTVLADGPEATVVRSGEVVAKVHAPGYDAQVLASRTELVAALPALFVTPLVVDSGPSRYVAEHGERRVTLWPAGRPVDPDLPESAPWVAAARLIAGVHRTPVPSGTVGMGGPGRSRRALQRLADAPVGPRHQADADAVRRAWVALPDWVTTPGIEAPPEYPRGLTHGDWHLGQLVETDAGWRLIDPDDVGVGPMVWDLARPAAWYALGMFTREEFGAFCTAYGEAGGPAIPDPADPWRVLDVPARALTVQAAAIAVAKAATEPRDLDDLEARLVDSCRRQVG
jgi:Phosphotransferase enzyme family